MKFRKLLIQGFYLYLLLATTGIVFLFIAGIYSIDIDNPGGGLFHKFLNWVLQLEGLLLAYHLVGLFMVILLKRKAEGWSNKKFALMTIGFFALFILPSLIILIPWTMDVAGIK